MKYMLKLTKIIIIMIAITLITGCSTENNTDGNTYKVSGDEYHNYIKETVKTIIK